MNTRKAIEATATLLRLTRGRNMGRKRLLALLYLADRESLKRTGRPIVGGKIVAMDYGPIHSEVYDLIKGGHRDQAAWSDHFENDNYKLILRHDPGVCALSRYEIGVLSDVAAQFSAEDDWDVAKATHGEEYEKVYKKGTSTPIPLELLIEAVGLGDKKDAILEDAKEQAYFDHLFAGDK